jgi:hypothetical protein
MTHNGSSTPTVCGHVGADNSASSTRPRVAVTLSRTGPTPRPTTRRQIAQKRNPRLHRQNERDTIGGYAWPSLLGPGAGRPARCAPATRACAERPRGLIHACLPPAAEDRGRWTRRRVLDGLADTYTARRHRVGGVASTKPGLCRRRCTADCAWSPRACGSGTPANRYLNCRGSRPISMDSARVPRSRYVALGTAGVIDYAARRATCGRGAPRC